MNYTLTLSWHHRLILYGYFLIPLFPLNKAISNFNQAKSKKLKQLNEALFIEDYLKAIQRLVKSSLNQTHTTVYGFILRPIFAKISRRIHINLTRLNLTKERLCRALYQEAMKACPDDTRIRIHDILQMQGFSESALEKIKRKIVKHPQKKASQQVAKAEHHFKKLTHWIAKHLLPIEHLGEIQPEATLLNFFGPWQGMIKYACLFAISFFIYLSLAAILLPLSSYLFYTVALAPLWYFIFDKGHHLYTFYQGIFSLRFKTQLTSALAVLKESELLILNVLTPAVVDLQSYDIADLLAEIKTQQRQIQYYRKKLSSHRQDNHGLVKKLIKQSIYLKKSIHCFVDHIIANLGHEIDLLSHHPKTNQLSAYCSKKQIYRYYQFVNQLGTAKQQHAFKRATDVSKRWLNAYSELKIIDKEHNDAVDEPWGGFTLRTDYLRGWHILLDTTIQDKETRKACLVINGLIAGTITCDLPSLKTHLEQIDKPNQAVWLRKIQNIIFLTLNERSPDTAQLLSDKQKVQCLAWFRQHQAQIQTVQNTLKIWLQTPNKDQTDLESVFQWLQGAQICAVIAKKPTLTAAIIKALEAYNGQQSWPFRLLYFLPSDLQPKYKKRIAEKRIDWIVNHLENNPNPFTRIDTELFHSLTESVETVTITDLIRNHPRFDADHSKTMQQFLQVCHQQGYDDGSLFKLYRKQHGREKIRAARHQIAPKLNQHQSLRRIAYAG